jgi:predicted kinase
MAQTMEAVIFIGIPAAGKTTFYRERFFETHIRLSMDMLRTRHRELLLVRACLAAKQPFVVDNTNVTVADRARYIELARAAHFRVVGYYFPSSTEDARRRNAARTGKARIPVVGIYAKQKRLEPPALSEDFDSLFTVTIHPDEGFAVEEYVDAI